MKINTRINTIYRLLLGVTLLWLLGAGHTAEAAITCNLTSNGFASAYVPVNVATNVTAASFTVNCTRSATGDATTQAVTVQANNGNNKTGSQNRAASGANLINYDLYTDSTCAVTWRGATTITATVLFSSTSDFATKSANASYWGCIPAGQTTVPAGTYVDTVTLNPSIGASAGASVSIVTPSSCSITSPPGNMTFNYVAFQAAAATASTTFAATCTNLLPFSMALDVSSAVSVGLAYTLSLSGSSGVGTGLAQSYNINGSMAGGQAGTCSTGSCSNPDARTLTITY